MKTSLRSLFTLACAAVAASVSFAAKVGEPAPAFTLKDASGKEHSLADFKGKTVVLEWNNPSCPFVVKHYAKGDMQKLQKEQTAKGVVWLTINSTNAGHQDFLSPEAALKKIEALGIGSTAYLLDPKGTVGKAYDARTTPHMFVVDGKGVLVYAGAIDSIRSANQADIAKAENYVTAALAELAAGKTVSTSVTKAYGCSVKYE